MFQYRDVPSSPNSRKSINVVFPAPLLGNDLADLEAIPFLYKLYEYPDNESVWIALVAAEGDEIERISMGAKLAVEILSHEWTWRIIMLSCIWYLCTSLTRWSVADLPLQIALVLASSYLSFAMRNLFRSSITNENNGPAEAFRKNPNCETCLKYNFININLSSPVATLKSRRSRLLLNDSTVILNAYETADAILKYVRANHDNFEASHRFLAQISTESSAVINYPFNSNIFDSDPVEEGGQTDVNTAGITDETMTSIDTSNRDNQMNERNTTTNNKDVHLSKIERQQLDLARLQINRPVVVVYNQLSFLPFMSCLGAIGGIIFMLFLWFTCADVESCVISWQTIPYTLLMMMWLSGGVTLFLFWRFCCELLTCTGTSLIMKLKLSRLGLCLSEQYHHLVMPSRNAAMEEYLLVQTFFIKISHFFQVHVVVSAAFLLLLFALGIYWGFFGGSLNYSIAMLSISTAALFAVLLSCTLANETAKEIENTLARSKPGDFSFDPDEAKTEEVPVTNSDVRADWNDFVRNNPIRYTIFGFAITRAWLTTFSISAVSSFFILFIQTYASSVSA